MLAATAAIDFSEAMMERLPLVVLRMTAAQTELQTVVDMPECPLEEPPDVAMIRID